MHFKILLRIIRQAICRWYGICSDNRIKNANTCLKDVCMKDMTKSSARPIKIQDNTFRDGHQSIYATRMKTEDMIPIAEEMDNCGFWAMEVWGGATFDTMHRFLDEDPWMRPKILKQYVKKNALQHAVARAESGRLSALRG